ncbi:MAG: hypothetical protein GY869_13480 [Planctomycetes bacterium]|nr:hypothetical protein [Planctomycetota bacterium]
MPKLQKELSLLKGNQKFLFRYEPGNEEEILDAFVDMAHDRNQDFDWFDAAVLSFQLSKNLVDEADELLGLKKSAEKSPAESPPWL